MNYNKRPVHRRNENHFYRSILKNNQKKRFHADQSSVEYAAPTESRFCLDSDSESSLGLSIESAVCETTSCESIRNINNLSYLKSKENELVELLEIKISAEKENDAMSPQNINEQATKTPVLRKLLKYFFAKSPSTESNSLIVSEDTQLESNLPFKARFLARLHTLHKRLFESRLFATIDSQSYIYIVWLAIVSFVYLYNIFSITIRFTFEPAKSHEDDDEKVDIFNGSSNASNATLVILNEEKFFENVPKNNYQWHYVDYVSDLIYLIDMLLIQTRIKFLNDGLWVSTFKETALNYFKSKKCYVRVYNSIVKLFIFHPKTIFF